MVILRKHTIEEREFAKPGSFKNLVRKGKRDFGYWTTLKKDCVETFPLNPKDKTRIEALKRLSKRTGNKKVSSIVKDLTLVYA